MIKLLLSILMALCIYIPSAEAGVFRMENAYLNMYIPDNAYQLVARKEFPLSVKCYNNNMEIVVASSIYQGAALLPTSNYDTLNYLFNEFRRTSNVLFGDNFKIVKYIDNIKGITGHNHIGVVYEFINEQGQKQIGLFTYLHEQLYCITFLDKQVNSFSFNLEKETCLNKMLCFKVD